MKRKSEHVGILSTLRLWLQLRLEEWILMLVLL